MKKQWNTSKHSKAQRAKGIEQNARRKDDCKKNTAFFFNTLCPMRYALCVVIFALCVFVSCAPKYAERPGREGVTLSDMLAKLVRVQTVDAVLSIDYEKNDATMSGDAFLSVSPTGLNLRIYYLGFLAGEVKEDNGVIRSKPKLDKYKSIVLVDGLKDSFMWWTIRDYDIQEKEDSYVLSNYNRKLIIDKKDLLPLQQTIELDNGEELNISYDTPARARPEAKQNAPDPEIAWYQSHMSISYRNHQVKVTVKSYTPSTEKIPQRQ